MSEAVPYDAEKVAAALREGPLHDAAWALVREAGATVYANAAFWRRLESALQGLYATPGDYCEHCGCERKADGICPWCG